MVHATTRFFAIVVVQAEVRLCRRLQVRVAQLHDEWPAVIAIADAIEHFGFRLTVADADPQVAT